MKRYEYVRLHSGKWIGANFEGHREIIDEHAKRGWRYAGYIPVIANDYGKFRDIDLIFEKDTEDVWNQGN